MMGRRLSPITHRQTIDRSEIRRTAAYPMQPAFLIRDGEAQSLKRIQTLD